MLVVKEEEVTKTVFDNRSSDEENSLANDRFMKDWDTDSDNDSVVKPTHIPGKIDFVKAISAVKRNKDTAIKTSVEKTESNAEFHEIVDFLTSSSIHHSLNVSPTIYASNIEQFWSFATSQTINDEKQIHAIVDGKTVVITESS
nr:hypothetical protein [Tanacetum cinerariifolium]